MRGRAECSCFSSLPILVSGERGRSLTGLSCPVSREEVGEREIVAFSNLFSRGKHRDCLLILTAHGTHCQRQRGETRVRNEFCTVVTPIPHHVKSFKPKQYKNLALSGILLDSFSLQRMESIAKSAQANLS